MKSIHDTEMIFDFRDCVPVLFVPTKIITGTKNRLHSFELHHKTHHNILIRSAGMSLSSVVVSMMFEVIFGRNGINE